MINHDNNQLNINEEKQYAPKETNEKDAIAIVPVNSATESIQGEDQPNVNDKLKEAGIKSRLDIKNKRAAAEAALKKVIEKQKQSLDSTMLEEKKSAELAQATAASLIEVALTSNTINESFVTEEQAEKVSPMDALLIGDHLLSPEAGLEKIKASHSIQMAKLIENIEAVMTKELTATVLKNNG